ncbi:MAG TPA: hypothetical protein VKV95_20140 [Terriglobia bacterium]|nr:hypothetical protein [Terriglobia bacterium]
MKPGALKVECFAGYKADQRPLRFASASHAEPTFQVMEVLDQWYGIGYQCFKVRADDGNIYILRHNEAEDDWTLDAFRREAKSGSGMVKS